MVMLSAGFACRAAGVTGLTARAHSMGRCAGRSCDALLFRTQRESSCDDVWLGQ